MSWALYAIVTGHMLVALSALKWWMRPLFTWFDRTFHLPPIKSSDFKMFCWTWSLVLVLIGLYALVSTVCHKLRGNKSVESRTQNP